MSYELMFQKAVELQQNGALNEAEQLYRQILETAPQNADVLNLLGLIAQTKGLHSEAVNYFIAPPIMLRSIFRFFLIWEFRLPPAAIWWKPPKLIKNL